MTLQDTLDALRGKFQRLRAGRAYRDIAGAIGVSAPVLESFVHGRSVREASLHMIEAWCMAEEARIHDHNRTCLLTEKGATHD